ncbi:MAG TPA: hypothetical protein VM802_20240 [Chitinophaga sp.]|uniref:hypothetical protein n=1 Tax=Chitinophaga sp. TaxID=1869181 RepID=UPI002C4FC074|nr:hypothetical protein [Chitinophaga sp.]HVI47219.1 hypothetical protein [Chitinophaga sp.]
MITAIDKNTALVLVDLQQCIVTMSTAHPMNPVIANAVRLLQVFREEQLPAVIVNTNPIGTPASMYGPNKNRTTLSSI